MINLPVEICLKFKEARKAKGMNQSALARAIGCQQSAISMFEGGMTTKLSDETVVKMADFLGIKLEDEKKVEESEKSGGTGFAASSTVGSSTSLVHHGYCPNSNCPSNVPYVVEGRLFYRPSRMIASPTGGIRCAVCGEVLEMRCSVCGASLNDGACCAVCGQSYVTPVLPEGVDVTTYARIRRDEIIQLRSLS